MQSDHHDTEARLRPAAAPIFIRTFDSVAAFRSGRQLPFASRNTGARQLMRQLAFQLLHVDRPVRRGDLIAAAGRKKTYRARPGSVVGGYCAMLHSWGMGEALLADQRFVLLRRHPCWHTDGDLLLAALGAARQHERAGDISAARRELETAIALGQGIFLGELEGDEPFDQIDGEIAFWAAYQREALQRYARLCLDDDDPIYYDRALFAARRALMLRGGNSAADFCLAARAARMAGSTPLASFYEQRARRLMPGGRDCQE